MSKVKATLGFIFSTDLDQVLLITKNRPDWQKGQLNGLGGKLQPKETEAAGMSREVAEEANLVIPTEQWHIVGQLHWGKWQVAILTCRYQGELESAKSQTDELVSWYPATALPGNLMSNLPWLIPLCMDVLSNATPPQVKIQY